VHWIKIKSIYKENTIGRNSALIVVLHLRVAVMHPIIMPHGRPTTAPSMQFIDSPLLKTIGLKEA
jgi:hypothetical protein